MKKILFNTELNVASLHTKSKAVTSPVAFMTSPNKRSKEYLDLIKKIDAKTTSDTRGMQELLEEICREFGTPDIASLPLGIVSKCFLGHPYEVHLLDISGGTIVNHYKTSETLPGNFEKARGLAMHNAYAMIEVYKDKMIIIRDDGTLTKVDN